MRKIINFTKQQNEEFKKRVRDFTDVIKKYGQTALYKRLIDSNVVDASEYTVGNFYHDVRNMEEKNTGLLIKPIILSGVFMVLGFLPSDIFLNKPDIQARLDTNALETITRYIKRIQKEKVNVEDKDLKSTKNYETIKNLFQACVYINTSIAVFFTLNTFNQSFFILFYQFSRNFPRLFPHGEERKSMAQIDLILSHIFEFLGMLNLINMKEKMIFPPNWDFEKSLKYQKLSFLLVIAYQTKLLRDLYHLFSGNVQTKDRKGFSKTFFSTEYEKVEYKQKFSQCVKEIENHLGDICQTILFDIDDDFELKHIIKKLYFFLPLFWEQNDNKIENISGGTFLLKQFLNKTLVQKFHNNLYVDTKFISNLEDIRDSIQNFAGNSIKKQEEIKNNLLRVRKD